MWLNPLGPFKHLPEDKEDGSNANHGVIGKERLDGETAWLERRVSVDENNDDLEAERKPRAVRLEISTVRKCLAVEPLRLTGLVESDVGAAHNDVVDDTSRSNDVREPGQNLG